MEKLPGHTFRAFAWLIAATLCLGVSTLQEPSEWIRNGDEVRTTLVHRYEVTTPNTISTRENLGFVWAVDKNPRLLKGTALLSNAYPRYLWFRSLQI